jgi:hypothetical protein
LLAIAPLTAISARTEGQRKLILSQIDNRLPRSASSNIIKGAFPPSSIETYIIRVTLVSKLTRQTKAQKNETFLTVLAANLRSCFPTCVEPVKETFLTSGLEASSLPISANKATS